MASLFSQLTANTNKLLIVHALYLYQRHLVDFFLSTSEDFNHVVSLVFTLFSSTSGSDVDNNAVFSISTSVLEKYFDLYHEETSEKLNLYMIQVAPKIFALLMAALVKARQPLTTERFAELKAQVQRDAQALRAAA